MRKNESPKIIYALLRNGLFANDDNSPSMRDLTLSWLRFGYQKAVFEAGSVESLLQLAVEHGGDFCVIQSPGNIVSEDWKLPHWHCEDFYQCVENYVRTQEFFVCANFQKMDTHFYLDTQCFIVNLQKYEELGHPYFGHSTEHKLELIQAEECSSNKAEDTESKRYLKSAGQVQLTAPTGNGWGFIDAAFRKNLTVPELPASLSTRRLSLLTQPAGHEISLNAQAKKSAFIRGIEAQLQHCRKGVFLWNIESYGDIQSNESGAQQHQHKIRYLYCVAAGFKPNMLLQRHGFEENACISFFDYSDQALKVRRKLMEEWDGSDYPDFCKEIINNADEDTFFQLWDGLSPSQINWHDVEQLWLAELAHWGGALAFQQAWQKHRALEFRYLLCDLVNEPAKLVAEIYNSPQSVIWWSNAFFTVASNWTLSIKQRKRYFENWMQLLAGKAPDCQIYGADYINRPINNICAGEYLKRLSAHVANHTDDELIPYNVSPYKEQALPLRF